MYRLSPRDIEGKLTKIVYRVIVLIIVVVIIIIKRVKHARKLHINHTMIDSIKNSSAGKPAATSRNESETTLSPDYLSNIL